MIKKILFWLGGFLTLLAISFIGLSVFNQHQQEEEIFETSRQLMQPVTPTATTKTTGAKPIPTLSITQPTPTQTSVTQTVPFTSQAPLAEWDDPRQQDGCEEASALMAIAWAKNEPLSTPQENRDRILAISDWENKTFGPGQDTSTQDTAARILNQYFDWPNYKIVELNTPQQLVQALQKNQLIITPMNGQALNNPNFTQPGPERHMVVVIGYDAEKLEFITNDPGTRNGKSYRYPVSVFWEAIRDYPTGDHVPIKSAEKRMIIIYR